MTWKYTGKGKMRSPAQQRQSHLRMKKGQIAGMMSTLSGMIEDPMLPDYIRNKASFALGHLRSAYARFNVEVGWKVPKPDGIVEVL